MVQTVTKKQYENTMKSIEKNDFPEIINLNVGGHHYVTKRSTLTKDSESMLAVMFSGRYNIDKDSEGRYFIDRDGAYFGYVLNFLRDSMEMPPPSVSVQSDCKKTREIVVIEVYKEAQFYQVQSLIKKLERNAQVFALKLDEAKKSKLGNSFVKWKEVVVTTAQLKSMKELSSSIRVNLLSKDDSEKLFDCSDCIGQMNHSIVITSSSKNFIHQQQSYEKLKQRLSSPDVLVDIPRENMELFIRLLKDELEKEGYTCKAWKEEIKCKNVRMFYGIAVEECGFCLNEYYVAFEWFLPQQRKAENAKTVS